MRYKPEPEKSKMSETEKVSLADAYLTMQKASGIEVGDTVKVLRKANDKEMGWDNYWPRDMDIYIGCTRKVTSIDKYGITVDNCKFPFFVLEITEKCQMKKFPLTFDDIPKEVLTEARNKYQYLINNGIDKWNPDEYWRTDKCSICQYLKNTYPRDILYCGIFGEEQCAEVCPMAQTFNWCRCNGGKLFRPTKETVANFVCFLNKHLINRP